MARETLRELTGRAGGEFVRRQGRYVLVRWSADDERLESRESLQASSDELEAITQLVGREGAEWAASRR